MIKMGAPGMIIFGQRGASAVHNSKRGKSLRLPPKMIQVACAGEDHLR
jgi:hypothetical protein